MSHTILVTGGAGFIGSNFISYILSNANLRIVNLDALTYAGNLENLKDFEKNENYHFVKGTIQNSELVTYICKRFEVYGIINFAAESHVDRSILNSRPFIDTNVLGTQVLLDVAKDLKISKFLQVSTDEVYGSLGETGLFTEDTPLSPNSPYSASKASADMLVNAYHHTFGLPTLITRCSNNYGPFQFPEKLIPLMILNALENKELPVYGNGLNIRDWIHVQDHCSAIWTVFQKGVIGQVYNVGGKCERKNIDIVKTILNILEKPETLIRYVKDRPGHDQRYAIDNSKIQKELDWVPKYNFETALKETINWYLNNKDWCLNVRSGAYKEYYNNQYNGK
ncbi:MAG: dTDP-glucose 4,6-dehydratase [Candidatus Kapabacteria bacterium]|nr:dTDP-glucose 4,6-dehydratase [Candidatus Kapabacteria bacterium]